MAGEKNNGFNPTFLDGVELSRMTTIHILRAFQKEYPNVDNIEEWVTDAFDDIVNGHRKERVKHLFHKYKINERIDDLIDLKDNEKQALHP